MRGPSTTRRGLLAACGTFALSGCLSDGSPASFGPHDWPMTKYDATGAGHNPDTNGPKDDVRIRWEREEYGMVFEPPSLVLFEDTVYYPAADSFLALDAVTGETRFELDDGQFLGPATITLTRAYRDETVVVPDRNGVAGLGATGGVELLGERAFTARWRSPPTASSNLLVTTGVGGMAAAPVLADDALYVVQSGPEDALRRLDPSSGRVEWSFDRDVTFNRPVVADGVAYVSGWPGRLFAVDRDGTERWRTDLAEQQVGPPTVVDGTVYVLDRTALYALDADDGRERWRFELDEEGQQFWYTSATVADGTVFVATESGDGKLYALDATSGEESWTAPVGCRDAAPVVADGVLYVPSHHDLYALDTADGRERWRFRTAGSVSTPTVSDGSVYVAGGHVLYALEEAR